MAAFEQVPYAQVRFTNFDAPFSAHVIAADGVTCRELGTGRARLQGGAFLYHNDVLVITQDRESAAGVPICDLYKLTSSALVYASTLRWGQNGQKSVRFTVSVTSAGNPNTDSTVSVTKTQYWK